MFPGIGPVGTRQLFIREPLGDVARCQSEQAQDPAGFADLYGVGADDEGAVENCVTASHDTSSTEDDSAEDSG